MIPSYIHLPRGGNKSLDPSRIHCHARGPVCHRGPRDVQLRHFDLDPENTSEKIWDDGNEVHDWRLWMNFLVWSPWGAGIAFVSEDFQMILGFLAASILGDCWRMEFGVRAWAEVISLQLVWFKASVLGCCLAYSTQRVQNSLWSMFSSFVSWLG